jgi:anti-anti-sigma factor
MGAHAADGAPVIVALPAEIDLTNVDRVYDLLDAAVASGAPVIVADLTGTTFCDSEGMQRLIMIHKRAACRDAQLRLAGLSRRDGMAHGGNTGTRSATAGLRQRQGSGRPAEGSRTRTVVFLSIRYEPPGTTQ